MAEYLDSAWYFAIDATNLRWEPAMQRKPSRSQLERDRRIESLIDEVQTYSSPKNEIPTPPRGRAYPPFDTPGADSNSIGDRQEGRHPYGGFTPTEHPWDRDGPWDGAGADLPVIEGEFDLGDSTDSDKQVGSTGADALAFYAPFHFYGRFHWGIYIREYGLAYIASKFKVSVGQSPKLTPADSWVVQAAWDFLLQHEQFHFLTEVASSQLELVSRHQTLYSDYFFDPSVGLLEEALANAHAFRQLQEPAASATPNLASFAQFLAKWMSTDQPPGYRDYARWVDWRAELNGKTLLTARMLQLLEHSRSGYPSVLVSVDSVRPYNGTQYSRVPVVLVADGGVKWLSMARPFPKAWGVEVLLNTDDHLPHHIHVIFDDMDVVKLTWDALEPAGKGGRHLVSKEKKRLDQYLKKYRRDIDEKALRTFPTQVISKKK